jgi:hypothetical protein
LLLVNSPVIFTGEDAAAAGAGSERTIVALDHFTLPAPTFEPDLIAAASMRIHTHATCPTSYEFDRLKQG